LSEQPVPRGNWNAGASQPVFNAPWSVLAVIGVLVVVHAGLYLAGEHWQIIALELLSIIPSRFTNPARIVVEGSQYWSLVTYMLLHGDWMHLLFNSLWLLVFGTPVARYLGSLRFFVLSLVAGIVGGLSSLLLHWGQDLFVMGASGAVSGLLAAAIPIMYGHRVPGGARPLSFGELVTSSRALMFTAIWLGLTLVSGASGWTGNSFAADSGIAWEAHIGGFIGGLAAFYALAPRRVHPA
jgi:membrane associated rhomboid family serine protease